MDTLRPGGTALTERALSLLRLAEGSRILDVGCGSGATVALLRDRGFDACGVDIALSDSAPPELICADAEALPFPDGFFDAVFFECSQSKISYPVKAMAEARRVLKPDGSLVIEDLFTNAEAESLNGLLGRLEPYDEIFGRITAAGFRERIFEEHRDLLVEFWAQLVFEHGLKEATRLISGCTDDCNGSFKASSSSYFMAIFDTV